MPGTIRDSPSDQNSFPELSEQHILNCAFSAWYERFRRVTLKSKVIKPLPAEFIDYLHADGVFLPDRNYLESNRFKELSDEEDEADCDANDDEEILPNFPELEQQIGEAINDFDGAVFPKLNWSSPRDAIWISATNTLKCNSPSDVFLLLKSSDFIAHDLDHAFDNCCYDNDESPRRTQPETFELILRKWYDVVTSMEFRCFVKNQGLIAISQRDVNYYPFLNEIKEELKAKIVQFFLDNIQHKFSNLNYVFDVYVTRNRERVWLIDFNPFGPMTDSLLYSWDEILSANLRLDLRLIETQAEASQAHSPPFAVNRYPREMIDFSQGHNVAEFAERFQRELFLAGNSNSEESSEDEDS
ncbi:hypothetical protein G9A89_021377 [Geosiphon pyriformis]|nr:hypothetical protein G9A89_021377 [Geosiphon pyriformis]